MFGMMQTMAQQQPHCSSGALRSSSSSSSLSSSSTSSESGSDEEEGRSKHRNKKIKKRKKKTKKAKQAKKAKKAKKERMTQQVALQVKHQLEMEYQRQQQQAQFAQLIPSFMHSFFAPPSAQSLLPPLPQHPRPTASALRPAQVCRPPRRKKFEETRVNSICMHYLSCRRFNKLLGYMRTHAGEF